MKNLLPFDGEAYLKQGIFFNLHHESVFQDLKEEIEWTQDRVVMFGKQLTLRRLTAWYGDQPYAYTYSKISREALPWSPLLAEIRTKVEACSKTQFNSCLANFYHDGQDYMGWHSDNEPELDPHSPIASVSFGAERKFSFRHKKTKDVVDVLLHDRSLLLMEPPTQQFWNHTLRKTKAVKSPRINLTFRNMIN